MKGFTLMEALIYISLVTLFVSSCVAAAFYLIASSSKLHNHTRITQEAYFIVQKIEWAIATKKALQFRHNGTGVELKERSGPWKRLNSQFDVSAFELLHSSEFGLDLVTIHFTIAGESFSSVIYKLP